ncbi:hypothetical protein [Teredinibacter sp. KSP-S5-2]|uniref:hypothetical protein n=1 Tax=Teredinibacter sp. KSP-S5-2 TaxID=3034506 RepID=UPI00293482BF|nr:hypothetical protein [Teredinibacter sp. KSP-S5-2]WNO10377.1 hypothetical protein P5V12_04260 [Teredinibacter sp. KSP-S5-2]
MSSEEIKSLVEIFGSFGIGAIVSGGIAFYLVKFFFPSYVSEKAKNLATKEDIGLITEKVEKVRTEYSTVLEEVKTLNQLKVGAVEREKQVKKEVLLIAVESIIKCHNRIANFSNLELTEQEIMDGFSDDTGRIAKVHIVGSEGTVKAVVDLMGEISSSILTLSLERMPLGQRRNQILLISGFRDKAQSNADRLVDLMKNYNLEGIVDKKAWSSLNASFDRESGQVEDYNNELNHLWSEQNREHLEFVERCMNQFFYLLELLPNVVLSIRNELDLDISRDEYMKVMENNVQKGQKVFERFISRLSTSQSD